MTGAAEDALTGMPGQFDGQQSSGMLFKFSNQGHLDNVVEANENLKF